jgi:hypothetical protein
MVLKNKNNIFVEIQKVGKVISHKKSNGREELKNAERNGGQF